MNSSGTIKPIAGVENEGVYNFTKSISPKVNVIARLEIELAYFEVAVHHVSHCTSFF